MEQTKRIKHLIKQLNQASKAYYQMDKQIMSDFEYDKLYDELVSLEKKSGVTISNSPTQNVGYQVLSKLSKVRHDSKMLSLDKTKEREKLSSFLGGENGLLSWKLDGLTIVLKYLGGELVNAVTRGSGEIGEDITHNAKVFGNVPIKISDKDALTLRGEAVITFKDFEKINDSLGEGENRYKNPRNLCSGTVRQLNSQITAQRNVKFYVFSVITSANVNFQDSKTKQLSWVKAMGFDVVEFECVNAQTVLQSVEAFQGKIDQLDYATDGLVLTFDSLLHSDGLGATSKFPKDAIAFKWVDGTATTTLMDIQWSTSRTGLINPVAVFEPVELEGTSVNKASLHNVSIIEALALGVGDEITVYKANMIIPQIGENLTKSNNAIIPKKCPVCNAFSEIIKIHEGKALYCTNPNCEARLVKSLEHFASRNAMNIEGFSEATIEKFVKAGFLRNYGDIYALKDYADEILNMEGFGERSVEKLFAAIETSRTGVSMANFIYALGVNHVGLSNAKLLVKRYNYDMEAIINAKPDQLLDIDGYGEVIAKSLKDYFDHGENVALLRRVCAIIDFAPKDDNMVGVGALDGLVFVITGDVSRFKNRKELQGYIESLGAKVTSAVTSKTTYLINNDFQSASGKNKKAQELGVEVITENEFMEMVEAKEGSAL